MNIRTLVIGVAGFVLAFRGHAAAEDAGIAGKVQVSVPVGVADVGYRRWGNESSSSQFRARLGGSNLFSPAPRNTSAGTLTRGGAGK